MARLQPRTPLRSARNFFNGAGQQYGLDRLCAELTAVQDQSVTQIRDHLLASVCGFLAVQEDDIALLVARHRKPAL